MALSIPATIFRVGGGSFENLPELILDQTFDQVPKISLINVKRNPMTLPITQCHSSVLAIPASTPVMPQATPEPQSESTIQSHALTDTVLNTNAVRLLQQPHNTQPQPQQEPEPEPECESRSKRYDERDTTAPNQTTPATTQPEPKLTLPQSIGKSHGTSNMTQPEPKLTLAQSIGRSQSASNTYHDELHRVDNSRHDSKLTLPQSINWTPEPKPTLPQSIGKGQSYIDHELDRADNSRHDSKRHKYEASTDLNGGEQQKAAITTTMGTDNWLSEYDGHTHLTPHMSDVLSGYRGCEKQQGSHYSCNHHQSQDTSHVSASTAQGCEYSFEHQGSAHRTAAYMYLWAVPITERQRKYHAEHGNTTRLVAKLSDVDELPRLAKHTSDAITFLSYYIDLVAYCDVRGIKPYIIGPEPTTPDVALLAQGLRYVCASIEDTDLRATVASNGNKSGPQGFAFLMNKFLQGTATQPALQMIVDGLCLHSDQSIVSFQARFAKFANALHPKPAATILCAKFASAITTDTGDMYESCVDAAIANDDQSDFERFTNLLTKLCTQRKTRDDARISATANHTTTDDEDAQIQKAMDMAFGLSGTTKGASDEPGSDGDGESWSDEEQTYELLKDFVATASRTQLTELKNLINERLSKSGGADNSDDNADPCIRCGSTKHKTRSCSAKPVCDFTFEDGERCARLHLRRFCWYEDPSRCRDPKVRDIIKRKLLEKSKATQQGEGLPRGDTTHTNEPFF